MCMRHAPWRSFPHAEQNGQPLANQAAGSCTRKPLYTLIERCNYSNRMLDGPMYPTSATFAESEYKGPLSILLLQRGGYQ
jgi:hypothetical protein